MGLIADIKLIRKLNQVEKQGRSGLVGVPLTTLDLHRTWGKPAPNDMNRLVDSAESWAFICAQKNGFSVAKVKGKLYKVENKGTDKQELVQIYDHPFLDLMKNVNQWFNRFELFSLTQIFLEITGNGYWWLNKDGLGIPREIWHLPSHWITVVPSKETFVAGYIMRVPGEAKMVPFPPEEVVQFKFPPLHDPHYGTPPMYGAMYDVDLNAQLKRYGIAYMKNDARPAGVLETESVITPEIYNRLMTAWRLKYGGTKNAGKIAVLEKGLKYKQIGSNLADIKIEDVSRGVRDGILAAFGVPASKIGLVEDVNRANADANNATYQSETIVPRLILLEEKINEKLMPIYDKNLIFKFDNPVPDDKDFRLKEQAEHIRSGYSSIDDERIKDGEEPYEAPETQAPLIPFNVIPAGSEPVEAGTQPGTPPKKAIEQKARRARRKWEIFALLMAPQERFFANTMRRFFEFQERTVMSNLNRYRSYAKEVKDGIEANIIFNLKEENERLKILSKPHVEQAYRSGIELGYNELGAALDFQLLHPAIMRAVDQRIGFFAERVNKSTIKLLGDEIKHGVVAGESIEGIGRRVKKVFDYSENFRSRRIAQTEVIGAANKAQLQAYVENGVEKKIWLTAHDERVRSSHAATDGQIVDITDNFKLGSGVLIQEPGDRDGAAPASEVINCRCTVQPVVKE